MYATSVLIGVLNMIKTIERRKDYKIMFDNDREIYIIYYHDRPGEYITDTYEHAVESAELRRTFNARD
jgi:hypothetical protein|tara:strand:+ start:3591 stop:3794 length:204 start_codon:yes stop_codon:yes gene_type:complete